MQFDLAQILSMVVGVILPLISGWLSKSTANGATRAVVLLGLAAVSSFVANWLDTIVNHSVFNPATMLVTVLGTFLVGVGTHFGLLSPTGAAAFVQSKSVELIGPKAPAPAEK